MTLKISYTQQITRFTKHIFQVKSHIKRRESNCPQRQYHGSSSCVSVKRTSGGTH